MQNLGGKQSVLCMGNSKIVNCEEFKDYSLIKKKKKKKKTSPKLKMFGPLCNQTVNLKTDSNTLYYSIMKLRSSPSILKHKKGLKKYAFLNNSRNNCHRNYTNRPDISTNAHVQINRSILAPYGTHAMIWGFLCIMDAGRRVNKITAVVLTIYMGKLPVGGGGLPI